MFKRIHHRLPPKKVKFYFEVWLCALLCALVCSSCAGEMADEANSNDAPNRAPKALFVSESSVSRLSATNFERNLPADFSLPASGDVVANRLLKDYGAMFVARGDVVTPPKIVFENAAECADWQSRIAARREDFGDVSVELQTAAMAALILAREELRARGLTVTARGSWAARRDYDDTVEIWQTRVNPALDYWTRRGRLSQAEAARIRVLPPTEQVAEVLRLEEQGMFFSKGFSKSILYSGTAPGASQHLSMLAFDANEHGNAAVRSVLAKHGWFQTVAGDAPHFTFLGASEADLPALGLKRAIHDNRTYWIPD